jgi:hypothetical protein
VVVKASSGSIARTSAAMKVAGMKALRRRTPRGVGEIHKVDMSAPIELTRRDAAIRRACGRMMGVDTGDAVSCMTGSRR